MLCIRIICINGPQSPSPLPAGHGHGRPHRQSPRRTGYGVSSNATPSSATAMAADGAAGCRSGGAGARGSGLQQQQHRNGKDAGEGRHRGVCRAAVLAAGLHPPVHGPPDVSNVNLFDFTYLMYRPLYWFGTGVQPTLNTSLSLASAPVFSGRNVTINLKNYKWSNGTPVTAQDVMFWINMDRAVPQDWFDYSPGAFPANVSNIKVVSSTELTMTLKKTYSSYWFLYNELSQITPMPAAWDRTASATSNCDTTVSDCAAVYSYLAAQAKDLDPSATTPPGAIGDGPWKLSAFNADGHITFVPNKSYSGP